MCPNMGMRSYRKRIISGRKRSIADGELNRASHFHQSMFNQFYSLNFIGDFIKTSLQIYTQPYIIKAFIQLAD